MSLSCASKTLPTLIRGAVQRLCWRALGWHPRGQRFDPAYLHQDEGRMSPEGICVLLHSAGRGEAHAVLRPAVHRQGRHGPHRRRGQDHRHVHPGPGAVTTRDSPLLHHHPHPPAGPSAGAPVPRGGGGLRRPGGPRLRLSGHTGGKRQAVRAGAPHGPSRGPGGLRAGGGRRLPGPACPTSR